MSSLMRTLVLVVWPHGGQRHARANALRGLRAARVATAEQREAAAAFDVPVRRAVSR
jgi:hypothetical protein